MACRSKIAAFQRDCLHKLDKEAILDYLGAGMNKQDIVAELEQDRVDALARLSTEGCACQCQDVRYCALLTVQKERRESLLWGAKAGRRC